MALDFPPALNLSNFSKEDSYNKIEAEILRLKEQIRSLLSVRNTHSPVSSLPNELLAKIFMHCCDFNELGRYSNIHPGDDDDEDDRAQPDMRLVVSWVSHHWRSVALGHRPLWNLVVNLRDSLDLDYVRSCAARCQHLLVDLARPTKGLLNACIANMSRITYFKLDISSSTTVPAAKSIRRIWTQAAPHLEALRLHSVHVHNNDARKRLVYPKLQILSLVDCNYRWTFVASLASTISKLEIIDPENTITVPSCVRLLESMPRLSECTLYSCLMVSDNPTPAMPCARLLQLTMMTIANTVGHLIPLLRAIDIPGAMVNLFLDERESIDQGAAELFCTL
ncbi:hypothetical protein BDN72DRAFT_594471 [Pluteus cervinus]|uniref:Uncharacterized protein n=1 Tax=Pluteus cervinus TaxID=181527 RepID=A0ACD3AV42_9AGAR|nr:hypothetical protein BDN72DRAFT_594471 [Pluteus cervinus]